MHLGREDILGEACGIFGFITVEFKLWPHLNRAEDTAIEDAHLNLLSGDIFLHHNPFAKTGRFFDCRAQEERSFTILTPILEPSVTGFTTHGNSKLIADSCWLTAFWLITTNGGTGTP